MSFPWLDYVRQIKAISQIGQTYCRDPYDLERYRQLESLSHEMIARLSDKAVEDVERFFLPDSGYATPKVDLRAGIIKDDRILLVKEKSDGCWTLPGGWADVCESPSEGIVREVVEESGYIVGNPRLVAVVDRSRHAYTPQYPHHIYKLFFMCDLEGGCPVSNLEISEIGFFDRKKLPELSRDRILPEDIDRIYRYHEGDTTVFID